MPYPVSLVLALLLTVALELPVCLLLGLRKKELLIVLLVNVMTNPAVNVLYLLSLLYTPIPHAVSIAVLELAAVAAEGFVYRLLTDAKRPFLISLAANAVSFGAGLLITNFLI